MESTRRRSLVRWTAYMLVWVAVAVLGLPDPVAAQTGIVTGRVTNAVTGTPLTSGLVFLCTPQGCATAGVNGSGTFTVALAPGSYVAYTRVDGGFVDEIVDNVPCPIDCDTDSANRLGAAIVVTAGATVTRNIALSPGGTVTGVVRDAVTSAPVAGVQVLLSTRFNGGISSDLFVTDTTGVFSFQGLGSGTYAAFTRELPAGRFVHEILGDIPCVGLCDPSLALDVGAPITVTAGVVTSGITFALEPGGRITGSVRRTDTNAGVAKVRVRARIRVGSNPVDMAEGLTDASGAYEVSGLAAGAFTIHTESTLLDEVHGGVSCGAQCDLEEIGAGQQVQVPAGGSVSGINFNLSPGGTVTGRLTDALTGTPIAGQVSLFSVTGTTATVVAGSSANSSGVFTTSGLPAGSYVALARANGHPSRLFGGGNVTNPSSAELLAGARVTVSEGVTTPNIDFALGAAATIRGRVRLSPSLAPAVNVAVLLFENLGGSARAVTRVRTDDAGNYTFTDIPGGLYQVATEASQLDNQVFNGQTCPGGSCTAAFVAGNGTLVPATAGLITNNINLTLVAATGPPGSPFRLDAQNVSGGTRLSWDAPQSGGTPTSYILEAGVTPGTTFATLPASSTSLLIPGIPPGVFFLRVRGVNGAGAGAPSTEFVLRVAAGGVVAPDPPPGLFPLVVEGRLTLTWDLPRRGPAPTSYQLEVGTAAGRSDIAVVPTPTRLFRFTGVPPGVYFVRVRSVVGAVIGSPSADVMMVAGNVPAPPAEPSFLTSTVTGNVATLRWGAPTFGPVTDYILEAGSQSGASNIAVLRLGTTATSMTIPGVPPGRYYLRLRAVNALGVSAQSFEHEMVVP
jgi:hypothetical protein